MSHKTAKILAIIITIALYIITLSVFLLALYIGLNSVDGLMESFNLKDFTQLSMVAAFSIGLSKQCNKLFGGYYEYRTTNKKIYL